MILKKHQNSYEFYDSYGRRIWFKFYKKYVYVIELSLPPGTANKEGVNFIRECIDMMFNETDALILCGYIKKENLASRQISHICGWTGDTSKNTDTEVYKQITIGRWINIRKIGMEKALQKKPMRLRNV